VAPVPVLVSNPERLQDPNNKAEKSQVEGSEVGYGKDPHSQQDLDP